MEENQRYIDIGTHCGKKDFKMVLLLAWNRELYCPHLDMKDGFVKKISFNTQILLSQKNFWISYQWIPF